MRRIASLLAVLSLTACGIYKPYSRPDTIPSENLFGENVESVDTVTIASMGWRELFADPCLQSLIEYGLENNTDIQTAEWRVKEAEAALKSARLAYIPSFNFAPNGGVSSFDGSKAAWTYTVPVSASWEIDIFGKKTNTKRQARVLYEQSMDYRQAVQTGLVSSIANQYYTLLLLDEQLRITRLTSEKYRESVRVMRAMKSAGMANEAGVAQIEAAYFATESAVQDLSRSISDVESALSVVLGDVPHHIERGTLGGQTFPSDLAIGVPVQLLSNRPDVRAAEQSLASAYYAVNIARASLYPSLSLSGTLGWTNSGGGMIVNPGGLLLSAAASILQPIFNAGVNRARVKIARAQQEEAALAYKQTVLNAGAEVNNALTQYQTSMAKREWRERQVSSLRVATEKTQALMKYSSTTYLEVLTAQQSLLQAELSQASDRFDEIQSVINLYRALGGGVEE